MTTQLTLSPALSCESCGTPLASSRIDLARGLATCGRCDRVFRLVGAAPSPRVIPDAFEAPVHPRSASTRGDAYRRTVREPRSWRYRWFRWSGPLAVVVGLLFAGVSLLLVGGAVASTGPTGLLGLLVPHLWIGLAVGYLGLTTSLNRTTIHLDARSVTTRTGPLPWRDVSIAREEVVGADFQSNITRRGVQQFDVRLIGVDHRATKLLGGLSEEEARYLAAELSEALAA